MDNLSGGGIDRVSSCGNRMQDCEQNIPIRRGWKRIIAYAVIVCGYGRMLTGRSEVCYRRVVQKLNGATPIKYSFSLRAERYGARYGCLASARQIVLSASGWRGYDHRLFCVRPARCLLHCRCGYYCPGGNGRTVGILFWSGTHGREFEPVNIKKDS